MLFCRSTQAEVQQVVNRNLENSQRMVVQGSRKDCIRLRGLPYEAHVENIVEFLGETARHIMFQVWPIKDCQKGALFYVTV